MVWRRKRAKTPPAEPAVVSPAPTEAPERTPARSGGTPMSVASWLEGDADPGMIQSLLREVIDPEIGINIIDLGLVYNIRVSESVALIQMTMTTPGCPLTGYFDDALHRTLWGAPGIEDVDLRIVWDPPWSPDMMSRQAKTDLGWPV